MKKTLALAALLFTTSLTPVEAAPIGAIIGAIAGAIGVSTATVALVAINLTASVVMSAVQRARMKKAGQQNPGIKTERKLTGGVNSRSIILGRYATAGAEVCPPYSRGNSGKTPNIFLTYIISLCDVPSHSLNRLIINGEYVPVTSTIDANYGNQLGGKYAPGAVDKDPSLCFAWIKFYDGSQTIADPKMVEFFNSYPDRPWTINHVGHGVTYAIITFRYQTDLFKGEPEVRYELNGAKLYDPRKDSSRGGSGTQRATNPSTWEFTENPVVMAYNVLKGIPLGDGRIYGAGVPLEDLPLTEWVAAMNICDEPVNVPGGTEPRYRAGIEIKVAEDEPADILDELMLSCMGDIVEIGGVWKIRAGGPGLPVMFVQDGDFIVTKPSDYDPFPPSNASRNTVNITYPHPEELWQPHDAPSVTKQEYLDRDGKPIVNELTINSAPFPRQIQRLANAWLEDDQRWRSHVSTLGPYALHIEPLDVIQWNSDRNFYSDKLFEITTTEEDLLNLLVNVGFRETDPTDYDPPSVYLPDAVSPGGWQLPTTQAVPGFGVSAYTIMDAEGNPRRAAIRCVWDIEGAEDARAINISIRRAGSNQEIDKSVARVDRGTVDISEGILPNTDYEVRAIYDVDRPVIHTSWFAVRTGVAELTEDDLGQKIIDEFNEIAQKAGVTPVDTLPASGEPDQIVMLIPPGRLYRWDEDQNQWVDEVYAGIPDGAIDETKFAQGIEPNKIIPAGQPLPTVKSTNNIVWNGALYTWDGTEYTTPSFSLTPGIVKEEHIDALAVSLQKIQDGAITAIKLANNAVTRDKILDGAISELKIAAGAVTDAKIASLAAAKITGQLTDSQLAGISAAKLAGQITTTQITDNAVTTAKILAGAVTANEIFGGAVTADKIATNAVTAVKILAGAVESAKIAADAVTSGKILANSVTAGKLAAGSVTTNAIAANAITAAKIEAGAIGADQIAAASVIASKLALFDFTNLVPDNDLVAPTSWTFSGGSQIALERPAMNWMHSGGMFRFQPLALHQAAVSPRFSVQPGKEYFASFQASFANINATAKSCMVDIYFYTETGAYIIYQRLPEAKTNTDMVYTYSGVVPATAKYAVFQFVTGASANTGEMVCGSPVFRYKNGGELIVDGAITTTKLDALAVTGDKIAANTITAGKIQTDAVESRHIKSDSITAAKIAAGAVSTDQLAAGAIVASKIGVMSFENLVPDGDITEAAAWTDRAAGTTFLNPSGFPWLRSSGGFRVTPIAGLSQHIHSRYFRVTQGDPIYIAYQASFVDGGAPRKFARGLVYFYRADGSYISAIQAPDTQVNSAGVHSISGTVPQDATNARFRFEFLAGLNTGDVICGYPTVKVRNGGELIVDGAITANKIATDAVTANAIAAGAIVASHIAAGAVVASKINVSSLSAISADLGTITTGTIRSGTSGGRFQLDHINGLRIWDDSGNLRVIVGKVS